jgi:AcrR family transcriptional regulator
MGKADRTRTAILEAGVRMASRTGFSGVSLAPLAQECALSKSGLFAHFASKEALQLAMLDFAAERFRETVVIPTLRTPRGLKRLRAAFDRSLDWAERAQLPGGCLFYAAAAELDDQPGPVRDRLVALQEQWFDALRRIVAGAIETGELSPRLDRAQFVSDFWGILLMHRVAGRLLHDPTADRRARTSFRRLIAHARSTPTPLPNRGRTR